MSYATANDLPAEIWHLIARNLVQAEAPPLLPKPRLVPPPQPLGTPLDDILDREPLSKYPMRQFGSFSKYMSVHRHLFNFYMDSTYEEVEWTWLDGRMRDQLQMLQ